MRRAAAIAFIAGLTACAATEQAPLEPWGEKPTPPLDVRTLKGEEVSLESLRGEVVVVNFWASWCEPCIAEMPSLARLADRMSDKPLKVVTVNYAESREKIDLFLAKTGLALPVVADHQGEAADAWGVGGVPMTFIVDKAGRVRYKAFGERTWDSGDSVARIQKLLAEKSGA